MSSADTNSNGEQTIEGVASKLGTKEHWDNCYDRELDVYDETGDVGEIWFGESCLRTMCKAIEKIASVTKDHRIVDLGCGNGYTLIELGQMGFTNLCGTDYSEKAIDLAKKIAEQEELDIEYLVDDIRNSKIEKDAFDVVLDKGTFDAMSLSEDKVQAKEDYRSHILTILKPGGHFVITSCNYTEQEILAYFSNCGLEFSHHVKYPVFKFGGSTGSSQSTSVFIKSN
ncbi:hypothetical protein DFA_11652 [Cavenderia fasciculata]|uniref:Protein-lysine N-methyltransferase DFA_11652 n=1 Tax=Cavenderia fasciculata TaxID=261658 RepID=F4QDU4_CACFS|nr:uncharacterized protein DFA_11652 [Cavenderia fasciculata]EGG13891.1 hypothetical protein DFA_11652 [Cavenderia fasciculata]|eukprot:XP_004350599.1 hypothetical protein DFA_11652 [Cavenderia fasciculata]